MKRLFIAAAFALCVLLSGCYETSKGSKVGIIVKCANEGFLIRTYECELIRGGLSMASGSFGKSFHFTVEDPNQIVMADQALNDQKEVKIDYHQEWITLWRTETHDNSFVDKIYFKKD